MKLLTAAVWIAIAMVLSLMYVDDQQLRFTLGSAATVLVFVFWVGQYSIIEEALNNQRIANNEAITEAYERGRKFGAIHSEDVRREIALARQREGRA